MGPPVSCLLHVLLQLHVDLHVVRVLLLEHLDLPPQVSQVLQLLLVRLDGRLVLADLGSDNDSDAEIDWSSRTAYLLTLSAVSRSTSSSSLNFRAWSASF